MGKPVMGKPLLCLGIETSCDETAAAVIADGSRILSNVVASQEQLHRKYGGVFPEVASRRHIEAILPVIREAVTQAGVEMNSLDLIAATRGPGLVGSLLVGVSAAKALAFALDFPLVGVNHVLAHIYANFLERDGGRAGGRDGQMPALPALCLVVSGGHTDLILLEGHVRARLLGRTRDDAAGEAFDKVARLLGLPYPGGPAIDRLAREGDPAAFAFPRAMMDGGFDFSFSGPKTAVAVHVEKLDKLEKHGGNGEARVPRAWIADVAASFQEAVVEVLVGKTLRAALAHGVGDVLVGGGVAANSRLREALDGELPRHGIRLHVPPLSLCTDNAAMVACLGYHLWRTGRVDGLDLDVSPRLPVG